MKTIGFVGLGSMGAPLAGRLLRATRYRGPTAPGPRPAR